MEFIKLQPAYKDYLWGGDTLKHRYHKITDLKIVAESWELSSHPDGQSTIASGQTFQAYLDDANEDILGTHINKDEPFPILIKLIDAKQALSIQVHPDDAYANLHENEYGKNEMWYIMEAAPDAFLYLGVNETLSKEQFQEHIEKQTLLDVLQKVPVKKGDCFFIEAGTIHAIGAGIVICEIQQNSNATYRVYDFGRLQSDGKPRPLHIEKARDVANLEVKDIKNLTTQKQRTQSNTLIQSKYFSCEHYNIDQTITLCTDHTSFHALTILDGSCSIKNATQTLSLVKGDTVFVPANMNEYQVVGTCEFIKTYI